MSCGFGKLDLHMHSTMSDGTDTPEELLKKVKAAGISIFAATDHDVVATPALLRKFLKDDDPKLIVGAEFSCKDEQGKYHILGYGFDPSAPELEEIVERCHRIRTGKVDARVEILKTEFGISLPEDRVAKIRALQNPGKPHLAMLMLELGYVKTIAEAFEDYLDQIHVPAGPLVRPEQAIRAILAGGGVPVLAHPFYGSGNELILGEEMENRLRRLLEFGLQGVEAYYSGFTEKLRAQMLALAERYRLYVTAGSDYHGTNKLVKLGDTGLNAGDEYPEGLVNFLRRLIEPCN